MSEIDHTKFMQIALNEALKGLGKVNPNPLVGSVIVYNNEVVAVGHHAYYGGDHAEVMAIKKAQELDIDWSKVLLYVNLEPCNHFGKTAPCVDLILSKGIKHCVIAMQDPNPLVCGQGITRLKESGVTIELGVLADQAMAINRVFSHFVVHKSPYIFLKCGITLDGKIATSTRQSRWITNGEARTKVQEYRHQFMAIMVGIGTLISDNPSLTCQLENSRNPYRVVLDKDLQTPIQSKVITENSDKKTILVIEKSVKIDEEKKNLFVDKYSVTFLEVIDAYDYANIFKMLGSMGIDSILVEGGSTVMSNLLQKDIWHGGEFFIAPKIMADSNAVSMARGMTSDKMADVLTLPHAKWNMYGDNVGVEFYK